MIKVAMIGFGGIAQLHRYAYWLLSRNGAPVRLIAACDRDPEKFKSKTKINLPLGEMENEVPFHQYEDMEECLKKEQPDLVDVCLPTSLHANTTIDLLKRGYAVLCEKPMASSYEDCLSMLAAAKDGKNPLMIGQCLRFYPEYEYLQKIVESGVYGKVIESDFYRFSPPPFWSNDNWQMDINRSGGCLVELNIHDIDYIRWCFGEPEKISCRIESRVTPQDAVESHFSYPEHTVKVRSAWVSPEEPFVHGYTVRFQKALVKMHGGKVSVTEEGQEEKVIPIENQDGIIGEIEYFVNLLDNRLENTKNPPESSAKTILLLETLRKSAENHCEMAWK